MTWREKTIHLCGGSGVTRWAIRTVCSGLYIGAMAIVIGPRACAQSMQDASRKFEAGSYSEAIASLQGSGQTNSAEVEYWLGRNYYELKDYDNAVIHVEKAVALDPKNSAYHQWLGRAYGGKADRDHSFGIARKVKKEFEEAVRLNPSNIPARRDLEDYCLDAPWIVGGSKDEAREQVDAITALDPIEGHLARIALDRKDGKQDAAEKEAGEVLAAKPTHPEPYFEVASYFQATNRPDDINSAIQGAMAVKPNDPRIGFYRGVADVLSGNASAPHAEQSLKAYIANTPERSDWPSHASARDWLGRLYEAQGKRSEAAEQYRAALQIEPGRKDIRERLEKLSH